MKHQFPFTVLFTAVLATWAMPAMANAGVPMLFVIAPPAVLLLVPIILIEALIAKIILKLSWSFCFKLSANCNAMSTLIGVPITWLILVILQMISGGGSPRNLTSVLDRIYAVTVQSPWLMPYESELDWMVPAASAALAFIFYLMSVIVEAVLADRFVVNYKQSTPNTLTIIWSIIGNTTTYFPVIACLLLVVFQNLRRGASL